MPAPAAEQALVEGDGTARDDTWSHTDPVTLFGAAVPLRTGWAEVSKTFRWLASIFADPVERRFDVIAADASGDLAYTVGYEHKTVGFQGEQRTYTLRVTHVYRREDGVWKIVHRHGDNVPEDRERPSP